MFLGLPLWAWTLRTRGYRAPVKEGRTLKTSAERRAYLRERYQRMKAQGKT
jgi:hypothetical protein